MFTVEPMNESGGSCDCCGGQSRTIWGMLHHQDLGTVAVYYFSWTVGVSLEDHIASFDLVYGQWGEEDGERNKRSLISLVYYTRDGVPNVSVIDAGERLEKVADLAGSALSRNEVIGTPLAKNVFAMFDAIYVQDMRLAELRV